MSEHLQQHEILGFDAFVDERRAQALDHLRACATCRAAWLAEDGSRVFSLLARAPISEDRLEQLSGRLDAALDELQPRRAERRGMFRVASIAASLLLAAVLGAVLWNHEFPSATVVTVERIEALAQPHEEVAGIQFVDMLGDDARVLDLIIGGTQILIVFDESIEL